MDSIFRKRNNRQKSWSIILSSGPDKPMKHLHFSQRAYIAAIAVLVAMPLTILALTVIIDLFNTSTGNLKALVSEKEMTIEEQKDQIEELQQEYFTLKEETRTVQQTIEEFKAFESRLSEMELEMPADMQGKDTEGSGGMEWPELGGAFVAQQGQNVAANLIEMKEEIPELMERFEETLERFLAYEEQLRTIPTFIPAEGRISSHFGNRKDPFTRWTAFHSGTDIAAPLNTPIYAAADGRVTLAGWHGGYGNTIKIDHYGTYETLYAHLNKIEVEHGDEVKKGDVIGRMGTTGRSTGVHLHYEIKRKGEYVDPYLYMTFHKRNGD
ncbi:murein DD-endopeptidase MepM/ murein hydrolase activator NlpD [Evansella vedderi]|uniref:Murein DD-endopeptidase MepM/ murein hydrolase activator NlpD n=1 Tax=Evansella vedderi TaxID=38282 RepID=A0ABU0A3L9_9BACI|nr:M23 family metallopeptidase [Evansella vedderi]MDQ0258093.1 murein DD-endopeptidase MepM/ murein hydrolase activator NlpD [Evansella vedderi]